MHYSNQGFQPMNRNPQSFQQVEFTNSNSPTLRNEQMPNNFMPDNQQFHGYQMTNQRDNFQQ